MSETPTAPPPAPPAFDPRRRLRDLLSIPERDRSDEQWDEIVELEIQLAPGNRVHPGGGHHNAGGGGQPGGSKPSGGGQGRKHHRPKQGGGGGGGNNNRRPPKPKPSEG